MSRYSALCLCPMAWAAAGPRPALKMMSHCMTGIDTSVSHQHLCEVNPQAQAEPCLHGHILGYALGLTAHPYSPGRKLVACIHIGTLEGPLHEHGPTLVSGGYGRAWALGNGIRQMGRVLPWPPGPMHSRHGMHTCAKLCWLHKGLV